ncbi:hypothetical protein CR513_36987 [Mucuna pruriens]|uniref:Rad60/SUMO-like domain-containing protein n=1 Tax=Mucuna pruriens TaxID=157652 RepID=A0A371FVP8_MUCPR|nr:hypothetical protein CR513_36987 [Mucuna pruriens]
MMDETEDLEPLFDYSRVQPPNPISLDDDFDDDEDVICVDSKKRKHSQPVGNENTRGKEVPVVDIEDQDDDWLPPPPKISSNAQRTIDEDSTLKELRLKKLELASFAESAKKLLQDVEESSKMESYNSLQSSVDDGVDEKSLEHSERAKIVISVQDKDGTKQIRMFMVYNSFSRYTLCRQCTDDKFERIVKTYAEKIKCDVKQIVLSFDGDKISSSETPASLGMEDDDIIEVHVKSS